jgi:capsular polysaccharide biosynthesis protein
MQVIDVTKEQRVASPPGEPTAPKGGYDRPPRSSEDLWSSMGHNPAIAVVVGLLLAVLLAAFGAATILSGRMVYTSSSTLLIDDPYQLATSGQVNEYTELDALRYKYAGLVGTDAIADPVASKLHLPVDEVLGALSTNVPTNSLLMNVEATSSSQRDAQQIAQAAANEVTRYINYEDDAYAIPPTYRFTFKVIDPATPALGRGPSKSKAATLAIGLGVLGFALGFLGTQLIRYARRR